MSYVLKLQLTNSQMVVIYNNLAALIDAPDVARFQTVSAAELRVLKLLDKVNQHRARKGYPLVEIGPDMRLRNVEPEAGVPAEVRISSGIIPLANSS